MVSQQSSKGLGLTRTSAVPGRRDHGPWNTEMRFHLLPTSRDLSFERNLVFTWKKKNTQQCLRGNSQEDFFLNLTGTGGGGFRGKGDRGPLVRWGAGTVVGGSQWGGYCCPLMSVKDRSPAGDPERSACCSNLRLPEDFPQVSVKWCL